MAAELSNLYPAALWENFAKICSIPHPSKKEAEISEFVKKEGERLGYQTISDEAGNVLIRKPATEGYENRKGVILQSHLDMVPQKNSGVGHDFEHDPIKPLIDGDWIKAGEGTTLGADNGIGVSAVLAILKMDDLNHGPLEALFTVDEETGMTGASSLQKGLLKGDILINLDSENEDELIIGCAGGITTLITFAYRLEISEKNAVSFRINVNGLKGGHSGVDIHLNRGNANKILNRLLWGAEQKFDLRVANIQGGGMRNAIPREAFAVVTVSEKNKDDFLENCDDFKVALKRDMAEADPDIKLDVFETKKPSKCMDKDTQVVMLKSIFDCPDGVINMSATLPGVVETSTNLATVMMKEGNVVIETLQRSLVGSMRDDVCHMIRGIFEPMGASVEHASPYPGWKPDPDSEILQVMKDTFKIRKGHFPNVTVIHAGLESGLIGENYPHLDLISCGPTIKSPHSPDEKVNIASVGNFWDFLVDVLKNIPEKE